MTGAVHHWLAEPPPKDVALAVEKLAALPDVHHVAVMPDVHLAHDVCIGVVTATTATLLPQAVGGDIGCGISAARFSGNATLLEDRVHATRIFDGLYRRVPQSRHPVHAQRRWPTGLSPSALSHSTLQRRGQKEGLPQLGTLGRGNHFLELQRDDEGALWVMVHSGSRALGPAIRDFHLRHAVEHGTLRGLAAESPAGRAYLSDLRWALAYAEANRASVLKAAGEVMADALGVEPIDGTAFSCHHNFVRREHHQGEDWWVHRKGAISAARGELGIIAGSMGTPSYHVTGRGSPASLCSSSHGAGRTMSRSDARRRVTVRELGRQLRGVWFDHRRASQLRDEAPAAYKNIDEVMTAQRDLTRIERRLHPLLSFKGV